MTLQNNLHYCKEVLVSFMFFLSGRDGCELSLLVLFTLVNSSHDSFSLMRSKHRVPLPLTHSLKGINCFSKKKKKKYIFLLAKPQSLVVLLQVLNQPLGLKKKKMFYCNLCQKNGWGIPLQLSWHKSRAWQVAAVCECCWVLGLIQDMLREIKVMNFYFLAWEIDRGSRADRNVV